MTGGVIGSLNGDGPFSRCESFIPRGDGGIPVVRVEHLAPAKIGALFLCYADKTEETLARVSITAIRIENPDAVINAFADSSVKRLTIT